MVKLFTHTDLDGVGCAILAKLAFGNEVDISYCNYDDIDTEVREFISKENDVDMCHITDIRIIDEVAKEIDEKFDNFYVLDHHPTALYLNKYLWCTIKIEDEETHIKTSGTEMYYHWLVDNGYLQGSDVLDTFAELVRNYDTWRWAELGEEGIICKQVNDLMYLYGRDRFITWCISQIYDCVFPRLYASDELILSIKQKEIDGYIEKYNLSKENREGFLELREDYNSGERTPIKFYTLLCYAFNNQIRFNKNNEYNMPFGKDRSSFNPTLRQKFIDFVEVLHSKDCCFMNVSFDNFDFEDFDSGDFVYCDPPYFNSVAAYNEQGGWTEEHEQKLLALLDKLNDKGVKFALSNNLKYNNPFLDEWKNKYKVHYLNGDYSNCNYHKINKSKDIEVLITNY